MAAGPDSEVPACWPSSLLHKSLEGPALVLSPLSCSPVHLGLSGTLSVQVWMP